MATVIIPTPLRKFTSSATRIPIASTNISGAIRELTDSFPDLKKHLIDSDGAIAAFINIFVDNEDIRYLDLEKTELKDSTVISIVPAIAGG
jgi:molybdopterin converting factor small subunit